MYVNARGRRRKVCATCRSRCSPSDRLMRLHALGWHTCCLRARPTRLSCTAGQEEVGQQRQLAGRAQPGGRLQVAARRHGGRAPGERRVRTSMPASSSSATRRSARSPAAMKLHAPGWEPAHTKDPVFGGSSAEGQAGEHVRAPDRRKTASATCKGTSRDLHSPFHSKSHAEAMRKLLLTRPHDWDGCCRLSMRATPTFSSLRATWGAIPVKPHAAEVHAPAHQPATRWHHRGVAPRSRGRRPVRASRCCG